MKLKKLLISASWLNISLEQYIEKFTKTPSGSDTEKPFLNTEQLKQGLYLRISQHIRGDHLPGPYRDAQYTISLYYVYDNSYSTHEYLACIGFNIQNENIVVKQIQGELGKNYILRLLKWERMLLAILTDWTDKNGFKQIRVIRAQDTEWYRSEERMKRMFLHYDVTARRSGFGFDPDSGQYIKVLIS